MKFVETPIFTKTVQMAMADDEYRMIQTALLLRPEQGAIIPGTGGLRKIRWAGIRTWQTWRLSRHLLLG